MKIDLVIWITGSEESLERLSQRGGSQYVGLQATSVLGMRGPCLQHDGSVHEAFVG